MKQDSLTLTGTVVEVLPSAMFRVQIDNIPNPILAYIGGKLRKNSINILLGDKVEVEMSVYDNSKGRITFRL